MKSCSRSSNIRFIFLSLRREVPTCMIVRRAVPLARLHVLVGAAACFEAVGTLCGR